MPFLPSSLIVLFLLAIVSPMAKGGETKSLTTAAEARGFNSEDIARQLGISVSGVKWNVTEACAKLDAATRAEAAARALRQHLLD